MEWLVNLFTGSGVAHSVFIVAMVIAIGLGLNRKLSVELIHN